MEGTALGEYRLLSELGSGGMGTVYLAEDAHGGRVAVKVLHPHLLGTPGAFERFVREAEIGRQIRHGNMISTLAAGAREVAGTTVHYLVMEYVEGETLRHLLRELGRIPEDLLRHIGQAVAQALRAIHEAGVVHRDLKPENILITRDHVVKVMDLGVARLLDGRARLSQAGSFVGSVLYAAPEQFEQDGENIDGRADLYALGLVLYELAAGTHPFAREDVQSTLHAQIHEAPRPLSELNPQVTPFLEQVIAALLAKDRRNRLPSAAELHAVLEQGESSSWWRECEASIRASTRRPLRRVRIPRETAMYGREEDVSRLRTLFGEVKGGAGRVVLLEGEAGIGKTRLLDEFASRALRETGELNLLIGTYPPGGAATAAGAFSTAYREHFGSEGLEETLGRYLTEAPALAPAFAAILRGEPPPAGSMPLNRDSLQTVFLAVSRALAAERPTIIVIEDLHYAPEEGRGIFSALAHILGSHRILLVGTARPGLPDDWLAAVERLPCTTRMSLTRLGPKDLSLLLVDSFRSERLARDLAFQIGAKSDGNPFFVFEIIRGLREGQYITQQANGAWTKTRAIDQIRIPSSVIDLIQARMSDLGEEERDLLDLAACCGFGFDPALLADALGEARIPVLKRLARLEQKHRLVRSAGRGFLFDHHQIQETLYERLPPMLREEYHALLGGTLERRENAADRDPHALEGALAVDLCEHFLMGARGERALHYLDAALDHLERGYLNGAALRLADRILAVQGLAAGARRAEILLRKAGRLEILGKGPEERTALDEAAALSEGTGDPSLRSRAHRALAAHLIRTSRAEEARPHILQAIALGRDAGDRRLEADATGNLGVLCTDLGHYEEACHHFERAILLAQDAGHRLGEALSTGNLGVVHLHLGRYDEARRHFERNLALARETGHRLAEISALGNLGVIFRALGQFRDAWEQFEGYLTLARQVGYRRGEGHLLVNLANLQAALGEREGARKTLDEVLPELRETGARQQVGFALHCLALMAEQEGAAGEAARLYGEALAECRQIGFRWGVCSTLVALGRFEAAQGEATSAAARLDEALELSRDLDSPGTLLVAAAHRALLPGGDLKGALAALGNEGRAEHLERMEGRFALARATGDRGHLAEAHRLLTHLRDHAPVACRETMMRSVPLHREIAEAWGRSS